jgi:hypothetical protein
VTREEFLRQEIERFKKRIATYQAMIAEYESELGLPPDTGQQAPFLSATSKSKDSVSGDPLSLIQGLIFFNKSQPEAARAFLEMVGYPLKTDALLAAVEKGGVKIGGKTATAKKQNFYTILYRSADVGLADKDTWGLVTWPGVTKKTPEESKPEDESKANSQAKNATEGTKPS